MRITFMALPFAKGSSRPVAIKVGVVCRPAKGVVGFDGSVSLVPTRLSSRPQPSTLCARSSAIVALLTAEQRLTEGSRSDFPATMD